VTFPVSLGEFANEDNAAVVRRAVPDLWRWIRRNGLDIHETVLDLEQATGDQPISDAIAGRFGTLQRTLRANVDPAHQCLAMADYRDAISSAHRHGMRVTATPVPFSLDDVVLDHNMGLADVLTIAPYAPGMYDEVYLQAYRAEFGIDLGAAYIVRYYRLMQRYFGSVGQVSLGNTGDPPYTTVAPLVRDVRMLAGLGATSIPIFDFDASVKDYGVSGLAELIKAGHEPLRGAQLAAAEHSGPVPSALGSGALELFAVLNQAANVATSAVTTAGGHPEKPNAWPGGCGVMRPAPLSARG
jgi:hypothetical protein